MSNLPVRLRLVVPFMLVMTVMTACSRGEVELKNTVSAYLQMLAESLAKPDAGKMGFFASPAEMSRIDAYIMLMLKDKKVLMSTLKKLDFRGVDIGKDKANATVTTREEWTYYYVDDKSRQPLGKEERIAYNNVYHLVKNQGHWVVDRVDTNETQPVTPEEPTGTKAPEAPGAGKAPGRY